MDRGGDTVFYLLILTAFKDSNYLKETLLKFPNYWGIRLAYFVEHVTLDFRALSLGPMLGKEPTQKKKKENF